MKKSIFTMSMTALMLLCAAGSLASCNGRDDHTINVQFVPSNDSSEIATLASNMAPLLQKIAPDYKFNITTGLTYAATTEALLSDQVDIGFLTASGYAEATLKYPGKVEVLMTSVRKGYKVQEDYTTEEEQIKAMNQEIEGYTYRGEQSDTDVDWYSSQLVVRKDCYKDVNGDGKIDILDMAGKKVGRMGATSGAGYLRPLKYLHDHGMSMVDKISDASKEIEGVEMSSYPAACQAMMGGDIDGFWGFTDVRYANFYSKQGGAYYHDAKLFEDYKVIAITDGIYNDTISCRANLNPEVKEVVKNAFKALVKDGDINTVGTGAYYLYKLYSHTGYKDAKDSDFESERQFYQFCVDNNLLNTK